MFHYNTYIHINNWENVNFLLDCSIFVFSLIFERGKKCYCVSSMKFTVAMQHIAWLKW